MKQFIQKLLKISRQERQRIKPSMDRFGRGTLSCIPIKLAIPRTQDFQS